MRMRLSTAARFVITLFCLTLLSSGNARSADQTVITDGGREVLLKQDGTWEFLSSDRFANTRDGRRVRLKADGGWEYAGNAPLVSTEQVRTTELDIRLQRAVIETHEIKVQKNKRVQSQTVFYVQLALSSAATDGIRLDNEDLSLVRVLDSKGKAYPVLSISPDTGVLEPGSKTEVSIRADGSPQWWKDVKSMHIEFMPGMYGIEEPIRLSRAVDELQKQKVDGFDRHD